MRQSFLYFGQEKNKAEERLVKMNFNLFDYKFSPTLDMAQHHQNQRLECVQSIKKTKKKTKEKAKKANERESIVNR